MNLPVSTRDFTEKGLMVWRLIGSTPARVRASHIRLKAAPSPRLTSPSHIDQVSLHQSIPGGCEEGQQHIAPEEAQF